MRPTWTALPPMPPAGAGSAQVESLDSYVARLGSVFGVSNGAFARWIASATGLEMRGIERLGALSAQSVEVADVLESLTGASARATTLWYLESLIESPNYRAICVAPSRRWCPLCLEDAKTGGATDRLIWSIEQYSHCGVHACEIVQSCPVCRTTQPMHRPLAKRFNCAACHSSLSGNGTGVATPLQAWANGGLEEVIAWGSGDFAERVEDWGFNLNKLWSTHWNGKMPMRDRARLREALGPCIAWFSFRSLLNIAFLMATTPLELLLRPVEVSSSVLAELMIHDETVPFPYQPEANFGQASRLLERLHAVRPSYLPPLSALCKVAGLPYRWSQKLRSSYSSLSVNYEDVAQARAAAKCFVVGVNMMREKDRERIVEAGLHSFLKHVAILPDSVVVQIVESVRVVVEELGAMDGVRSAVVVHDLR